ncbi:flagellar hook-length control protein FliK [Sphingomonas fuzhouensis]|uniref:flagellar hook-length control protein FliK n=1 Tax=Sphingomonas fuzhouensis TaxID=3106033 RepID=UPI002AFF838A|nr:flagellar hook-length control protein FliK [Sphingomonas sp. SGZ-02]
MMSSISSTTPSGTASARSAAGAGAGDPMASAFAMLFAMMPGAADTTATGTGDGQSKTKDDGAGEDGSTTEKDGKELPSDAVALPGMPFAIPTLPLAQPEPVAAPVTTTGASAAPITTLLAAMPTLPDARTSATTSSATLTTTATPDSTKGTMPVPPAMTAATTGDTGSDVPLAIPAAAQATTTARDTSTAVPLASRADASASTTPVDTAPVTLSSDGAASAPRRQDIPSRFTATSASAPVVAPLPAEAPAPTMQPGQTASAAQLFGLSLRSEQSGGDSRTDRRKDEAALSVDPATLTRADSLTAMPVTATSGAEQAPLDMTQAHWPQDMIDRIDRMREDAATADTRIQLSPDALGGIAVKVSQEGGTTHIHFTADQAQTATMLADAQPTLARLAEDKGMRLGQTAVDLGQSGAGGDRQAPPRRPDPVLPTRPAFNSTTASSDAGDSAAASTRIA